VPHRSEPRFLVLHGLRLKGFADTASLAERAGLDPGGTEDLLRSLTADGLVRVHETRPAPWSLTPEGRAEHGRLVTEELESAGAKAVVDDAFRRFLAINTELLAVCTAWQLRPDGEAQVVNDHSDPAYDRGVVERLSAVDRDVQPITGDLRAALERYGDYGTRLATALERVVAGQQDWFTKPMIDSYHTVWFELHEDLLSTLGIKRGEA
jgi:hypothetical protein